MATVTYFADLFDKKNPVYYSIDEALARIENGASLDKVAAIREEQDKDKRVDLKKKLPGICFSGKFAGRFDNKLIEHSGFIVLDFDNVPLERRAGYEQCPYAYAVWLSPSGNGFKMLVKVQDSTRHREHFRHIKEHLFPECDASGSNPSRFCFESYDPEIYINRGAEVYTKVYAQERTTYERNGANESDFDKLVKWIEKKGRAFASGERNTFIFTLSGAACRFGIREEETIQEIRFRYLSHDTTFTEREAVSAIRSAYRANKANYGSASFDSNSTLIEKTSKREIDLKKDIILDDEWRNDIIYASDVKAEALSIKLQGYGGAETTGIEGIDFKLKRGELTVLTGYGNLGKSRFMKYIQLSKSLLDGTKWCMFSPEEDPSEYYHDLVEMHEGQEINGGLPVPQYVSDDRYNLVYDWIGKHFFYVYPKTFQPTPQYILELFLKMIIKHGIDGLIIDPWNQLMHDYTGKRDDQYLETLLGQLNRFAKENNIFLIIVAHTTKPDKKQGDGNYPCPDYFDIKGGMAWQAKADNILVYHRPFFYSDYTNPLAEFHKKKIKKPQVTGKRGFVSMDYDHRRRRFIIGGIDYMGELLRMRSEKTKIPIN